MNLAKEIWTRELRIAKIEKDKRPGEEEIRKYFGTLNMDDFYERIGQGELPLQDIHRFLSGGSSLPKEMSLRFFPIFGNDKRAIPEEMPLQIGQETSLVIHFADCCAPLPGDEIVGILRPKIGIEVHNRNCPNLKDFPVEQQIAVAWSADVSKPFMTHLTIDTDNRKNITLDVLEQLKGSDVALDRMSVASAQSTGRIRMEFKAFRKEQVDSIITKIKQISGVREVSKA